MAYGNYSRNSGGYSRGNYGRSYGSGGYSGGYRRSYGGQYGGGRATKKHSGCKMRSGWTSRKTGERVDDNFIQGWNYSRRQGLISFIASPRKERQTANSNFEHWVVNVQYRDGKKTFTGFFNVSRNLLTIPDLKMVANPNAPNGGYFGTFIKSKR